MTTAGLLLLGSVTAAGAALERPALWRVERGENDGSLHGFAVVAWKYDGGNTGGLGAATPVAAINDQVSFGTGDSGFGQAPTAVAFHRFGDAAVPERILQERDNVVSGGGGAAHGVIVLAFEASVPADGLAGPRGTGAFVPPIVAVACPEAWLDSVEVSGELPRGGTGLQNTGYALRFEVPEPGAYGLIGTAVCAAVALGRRRRGGPNVRTENA